MTLDDNKKQYLHAMGISLWRARDGFFPEAPQTFEPPTHDVSNNESNAKVVSEVSEQQWEALKQEVVECVACPLHETRTQTVFGVGNHHADWMIIGEAPGRDEDAQGEPFVGRAGQLLNEMLFAIGLKREQVFIANILKCRPPNNRDPSPEEAQACEHFLKQQIQWVKPKVILAVGRIAAQNLLHSTTPIGKLRGQLHKLGDTDIPIVVTYHPAYLLRSPLEKRKAWDDLLLAHSVMESVND